MNPSPSLQGALWNGNQQLATKKQLLSSISGLYADLQDLSGFNFQNLEVSTLSVKNWISTPLLYVSDIQGYRIDISGISATTANFNLVNVSSLGFTGPSVDSLVKVNVDFNLGDFVQGALIGTGALLFETAVGIGVGAGATFIGIGNGIASLINSKDPVNNTTYINTTNYEVMGGSTQLQVSTLGNAYPAYSSIMRYVSSISPNQVPGAPMFTSTIFYPGQICIRSISDPYPLVTGDTATQGSTIQQFGEWVPLEGLEPENIVANSISTNNLSTGNLVASLVEVDAIQGFSGAFSNIGAGQSLSMNYQAPLNFQTGATNYASFVGDLNRLYCYNTTGWIYSSQPNVEMGSLYVGQNANESLMNISSIYSIGEIKTQDFYASTITAEKITAISSLFITSTNLEIITSTVTVNTDNLLAINASIANFISSFSFTTPVGNPFGPFDINRTNSYFSTTYDATSSLTQNILSYSLNTAIQEETSFNIYNGQAQLALYNITPQNVSQWASTNLIFDTYEVPGQIDLGSILQWGVSPGASVGLPGGATFDVTYTYSNGYANSFLITEEGTGGFVSTFFSYTGPAGFTGLSTFRFTLPPVVGGSRSGWWQVQSPAPPPYESINNNTFQIYQDINDTYIQATDRLHLRAGDIVFDGTTTLSNVNIANFYASNINTTFLSSISTASFGDDTYFNTNIWVDNAVVGNSGDFSSITTTTGEIFPQWQAQWSSNYSPPSALSSFITTLSTSLIQSLFMPEVNRPVISVNLGATDDMTLTKLGLWLFNGVPQSSNYALGTFLLNPTAFGSRIFTDNNGFGLASNLQVVNLSNVSPTITTNLYIGFPGPATPIPPNTGLSLYYNNATNAWTSGAYSAWSPLADTTEVDITQGYNWLQIASPSTIMNSNVTIGGTLSLTGKTITIFSMTWNHDITTATQHGFGAVQVQDGNGNLYNASQWRMVYSVYEINLNSVAYAMNAWELSPAIDGNGNYIINYSIYYTSPMAITFQMFFYVDVVMYPREMVNVQPNKNWGNI
jgi:hypothetical protein